MNIVEAKTGEASLNLGDQGYEVVVPRKGVYNLELTLLAPVIRQEGAFTAKLILPRSPVSRLSGVVPGKDWKFQLGGDSRIEFSFGEIQEIEMGWGRDSADSRLTPLLFADTSVRSRIVPGAIQTTADIRYRILRAGVDTFELEVPASHEVLLVEGDNLKEWALTATGKTQRVAVRLHADVRDSYELHVVLEKSLGALPSEIDVPTVQVAGVARQSGTVELSAASDLEVSVASAQGLSQQALEDREDEEFAARYRFLKVPFAATLRADRARAEIHSETITAVRVKPDTVEWRSAVSLDVARAPLFEAGILIPAGFGDCRVSGEDVEDFKVTGNRVQVRLARQSGRSSFQIEAARPRATEEEPLETPLIQVVDATSQVARLGIEVDPSLDPITEQTGDLLMVDPETLGTELAGSGLTCEATIGFRYAAGAKPARITFKARKPQVTATVSQLVRVEEESAIYRWWIDYEILFAGTNRLILRLPAAISEQLQVGGLGQREINRNYRYMVDGKPVDPGKDVFWAVTFSDRQQGKYRLELALDQPHPAIGFEKATTIGVPVISLVDVFRETGQLAVATAANLTIGQTVTEGLE
ncbi:MAG: hypothetical protein ABL994_15270, partial [Verrucomicrobiales bacterium]